MSDRRTPPKRRHTDRPSRRNLPGVEPDAEPDTRSYSAPSHVEGSFIDAGYSPGRGQFGFVHHAVPPLPEWE